MSLFSHAFSHQSSPTEETCGAAPSSEVPASARSNKSSRASDYIEHSLEQLHRQCERSSPGSWLFAVQIWLMVAIVTFVLPLIALAAANLAGASVTDAMGDTLHSFLTQALHPYHLAPLLLFFAPICTGVSCFVWWLAIHHYERPPLSSRLLPPAHAYPQWGGVSKVGGVSVGGQVRCVCVAVVFVFFACCFPRSRSRSPASMPRSIHFSGGRSIVGRS